MELHNRVLQASGGSLGLLDLGALESAVAQPRMVFADEDLYPSLPEKAGALGFSLIQNHPFLDGNKRTGHAAMETFLVLNGHEIKATVEEQETVVLQVAASEMKRQAFVDWLREHIAPLS